MGETERDERDRLDQLEDVCAELYQVLGTLGAPARVLDRHWQHRKADHSLTKRCFPSLKGKAEH